MQLFVWHSIMNAKFMIVTALTKIDCMLLFQWKWSFYFNIVFYFYFIYFAWQPYMTFMSYISCILLLWTKELLICIDASSYFFFGQHFIKAKHFERLLQWFPAVKRVLIQVTLIYLVLYTIHIWFRAALNKNTVIQWCKPIQFCCKAALEGQ